MSQAGDTTTTTTTQLRSVGETHNTTAADRERERLRDGGREGWMIKGRTYRWMEGWG